MEKRDFENKLNELNFKKVHRGILKLRNLCEGEYYIGNNQLNIYGCRKNKNKYIIFFKDSERGITTELGQFDTESEAYDKLFEVMNTWEEEHSVDKE